MLKFHKVTARNFLSVGDKPITIQLDAHPTTLVQGKNGSAKSGMLLDTLSFALYGRPFRKINVGQLINSFNKRDCLVEVEWSIGSKKYQVRRGMRPDIFEVRENGKLIKREAGKIDHQEKLEKQILRMNHKSFCQIVTIGSATFVPFMQLGPGARREIIEDLLDLQVFSQMNRLLKQRVDENRNSLSEIRYQIDLTDEKIKLQKQFIQNLKQKSDSDKEDLQNKIDDTLNQISSLQNKIAELTEQVEIRQNSIQDAPTVSKRRRQYSAAEGQLEERIAKLRKELKFYSENDHCPTCRQTIEFKFKAETVEKKNNKISEINGALEQMSAQVDEIEQRLEAISEVQREISVLQQSIDKSNSTIVGLNRYVRELQKQLSSQDETFTESVEESKLNQLREDKEILALRKEELINQKAIYDVAAILLKDGGIKSKIIKQYIPIINSAINQYLSILDLNVSFELDENFKEIVKSRGRETFSYESFSEGEKRRIDLALTFAWRSIASMRNSSHTNLLILDEVADGGVDSDGIDDLVKIITALSGTHVFIISHRESMVDKFEHTIRFEKVKNFSKIVEE